MCTINILLYLPMLKWYLEHRLEVTAIHKYLKYEFGQPFSWFSEEVSEARCDGNIDPSLKQLGNTYTLKENSFYCKLIADLMKHLKMTFTTNEELVDKLFRSSFFKDLEEINARFEIKQCKQKATITRAYQYGIGVYQLAKLRMLEFYYDLLDKYLDWHDFELIQMDTDLMYMAISGEFDKMRRI